MYQYKAELIRVVDGDTLDLIVDLGMKIYTRQRIRLAGINTPETYGVKKDSAEYKAGIQAKGRVEQLLHEADAFSILTQKDKRGKYGRYIAEIILEIEGSFWSLNDMLITEGLAEKKSY